MRAPSLTTEGRGPSDGSTRRVQRPLPELESADTSVQSRLKPLGRGIGWLGVGPRLPADPDHGRSPACDALRGSPYKRSIAVPRLQPVTGEVPPKHAATRERPPRSPRRSQ